MGTVEQECGPRSGTGTDGSRHKHQRRVPGLVLKNAEGCHVQVLSQRKSEHSQVALQIAHALNELFGAAVEWPSRGDVLRGPQR